MNVINIITTTAIITFLLKNNCINSLLLYSEPYATYTHSIKYLVALFKTRLTKNQVKLKIEVVNIE